MWTSLSGPPDTNAPCSRTKHSATLLGGFVYVLGGRNGNVPLKDFWRYSIADGKWEKVEADGDRPPCLQEHTAVPHKKCIYVFGGELGFSSASETPLWIYCTISNTWRKISTRKGVQVPKGRRGHIALVHKGAMLLYGGYQDLRGSSGELWAFNFDTESWHLLSPAGPTDTRPRPSGRHKHSAVMHDGAMWVYGGMTDLQEKADFWRWDTVSKLWTNIKTKVNPGPLHSHAACKLPSSMLIFGGEATGQPSNEMWRFHFGTETWEKLEFAGTRPQPRAESIALSVTEVSQQEVETTCGSVGTETTSTSITNRTSVQRPRTAGALDRPRNPGSIDRTRSLRTPNEPPTILKEISRLYTKCSYTALNSDSTESLLLATEGETTPVRMKKSQSACAIVNGNKLTPVEATKLVYLDSEDEKDLDLQKPSHSESYSSHLVTLAGTEHSWRPSHGLPKSASAVRFKKQLEEIADESITSDYCSIETISDRKGLSVAFSNPHYMGPSVKEKHNYAKMLGSPQDSGLEDLSNAVEMKRIRPKTVEFKVSKQVSSRNVYNPTTAPIDNRKQKLRANSASRAERPTSFPSYLHTSLDDELSSRYVFVIGGKEHGKVTVFQRPISVWKLQLSTSVY